MVSVILGVLVVADHLVPACGIRVVDVLHDRRQQDALGDDVMPRVLCRLHLADQRLVPVHAVLAGGVIEAQTGKPLAFFGVVPHLEELFLLVVNDVPVDFDPPAFPWLVGLQNGVFGMRTRRMERECHVIRGIYQHLVYEELRSAPHIERRYRSGSGEGGEAEEEQGGCESFHRARVHF